jgi:hypothetical protein
MNKIKKFFSITEKSYNFEMYDLTTLITILNVTFILMGFSWAPILGIINCIICIVLNIINKCHINSYITQLALIVLNIYFLTL